MEDVLQGYIEKAGFVKDQTYFKEMYLSDIEQRWNIDLSKLSNLGKVAKRFDYVVKTNNCIYALETNFYDFVRNEAKKYNLVVVPSDNFGVTGYVRLAYCVSSSTIINSMDSFKKLYGWIINQTKNSPSRNLLIT